MSNEKKDKPDQSQTWGYYKSLKPGEERDEIGLDWFTAGYIRSYNLDDKSSLDSLHALVNSFTNQLRSQERPFMLIIESATTRVEPGGHDPNELIVRLEPEHGNSTVDELRDYADKIRIK